MSKAILLDTVEMAMLQKLAKKSRVKPDEYLKNLIKSHYDAIKR